ncbi:Glutathione peroxidase 2 [Rhinocladiella similis]
MHIVHNVFQISRHLKTRPCTAFFSVSTSLLPRSVSDHGLARIGLKARPFSHSPATPSSSRTPTSRMASATTFFEFTPKDKRDQEYPLAQHKGKVILAVNTASKCGFTPQFAGLEALWKKMSEKYPDQFVIIGFPCNQFGGQDPGSNDQIQEFCQLNYGVTFPVLGKTNVNGDHAEPVFEWMKSEKPGLLGLKRIKWNFEKFLISRDGKVVQRWGSITKPESIEKEIIQEIEKSKSG